jgi:hypothetical protein
MKAKRNYKMSRNRDINEIYIYSVSIKYVNSWKRKKEAFDINIQSDVQELAQNVENVIIHHCKGILFKHFLTPHCALHFANVTYKTKL